ncbi:MAG: hypothetical protein EOM64_09505 [Erysipelotrichia bacterium]|nr:hypothetical protein [Erysipelotrichia bacterium]
MAENQSNAGKKGAPITNDALKKAIDSVKENGTKENQNRMFDEIRKASLLVPVLFSSEFKPDGKGRITMPKGTQIKFILVNTVAGKSFFPVFTDMEEAKKLKISQSGNLQYVVKHIAEYETILNDPNNHAEGMVINPMSQNIVFPKQLVQTLNHIDQAVRQEKSALSAGQIPAGVQVKFTEPTIYPTALVNAVHDWCQDKDMVKRVWLKAMIAGSVMSFALIVDTDDKSSEFLNTVREIAVPHAKEIPVVALLYTEQLEKTAVQNSFPLYDKELGL